LVHAAMPNLKVTTRADLILAEQLLRAAGRLAD
jgi:2-C-methyl-D-erythritol 4-phosphate cytidylyltransferase